MHYFEQNTFVKARRGVMVICIMILQSFTASAAVQYVDVDNTSGIEDGTSWATAFTTIQDGVAAAPNLGEVWVAEGTYTGTGDNVLEMKNLVAVFGGFSGTETLRVQRNWNDYETIIDGENVRRCVYCSPIYTVAVDGFTITNGYASDGGGMYCGSATNCNFLNNTAEDDGGGMYDGIATDCIFSGNTSEDGGGMRDGTATNCTFTGNIAERSGGGMMDGSVTNCTFTSNEADFNGGGANGSDATDCTFTNNTAGHDGGGIYSGNAIKCTFSGNIATEDGGGMGTGYAENCIFIYNTAYNGGGKYSNTTRNCTFFGNIAANHGGGQYDGAIENSILWNNYPDEIANVSAIYSSVKDGYSGEGNIENWPCFLDADAGNFRLAVNSPCLDSGTSINAPAMDIRGTARPQGVGIDMGAYEMTVSEVAATDLDSDGMSDIWETKYGVDDPAGDPDGDTITNLEEYLANTHPFLAYGAVVYVDLDNTSGTEDGISWATAFTSIQDGVDISDSAGGGEVWVAEGTYTGTEDNVIGMKNGVDIYGGFSGIETLREQRDWDNNVTIIDGENLRRAVYCSPLITALVDGFTISQGNSYEGPGMYYGTAVNCIFTNNMGEFGGGICFGTAVNCIFQDNSVGHDGGGMYEGSATDCTFLGNSATYGAGMYGGTATGCTFSNNVTANGGSMNEGIATDCTFSGNHGYGMYRGTATDCTFSSNTGGAGMYNGTAINCLFVDNTAGGMHYGTATACIFEDNFAQNGGGMNMGDAFACYFKNNSAEADGGALYDCTAVNCMILDNSAGNYGGGTYDSIVTNCTLVNNIAMEGGGIYNGTLKNCIVWDNVPDMASGDTVSITYSCVQSGYGGEGNIPSWPCFVDPSNDDFRLAVSSPCLDTGTSDAAPLTDIRDTVRPQGSALDIGAYEMEGSELAAMDLDSDGILDSWELYYGIDDPNADPDLDSMSNLEEYLANTHPLLALGGVLYVDLDNISGIEDGLSWATAFNTIQEGVDAVNSAGGGEVWVAEGTYTATTDNVVVMYDNVYVYGGFIGVEAQREERNPALYVTVVDGESIRRGVYCFSLLTPVIDGFTITNGYAVSGGGMNYGTAIDCIFTNNVATDYGGGMNGGTAVNCTFTNNTAGYGGGISDGDATDCSFSNNTTSSSGGGMFNGTATNCTFDNNTSSSGGGKSNGISTNCTFSNNMASYSGGGMANGIATNCTFDNNRTLESLGGGMHRGTATNCIFVNNTTAKAGGGMADGTATNCTFVNNTAIHSSGGGAYECVLSNCILWNNLPDMVAGDNEVVTYSCVQGGYAGTGNITSWPCFVDVSANDFRLGVGSPCLNTGTATGAPSTDIGGTARPQMIRFDMGAYEMSASDLASLDLDGDGMNDAWEVRYGVDNPSADPDNDDATNLEEYFANTNPLLAAGALVYVDLDNIAGPWDGTSWATAFTTIQESVDVAATGGGGEVWVAEGTYTATGDNVVVMGDGVHIYGGFAGTESLRTERDWDIHETTIDGENVRRGILCGPGMDAVVDGFTVTQGGRLWFAGGMCYGTAVNCVFSNNSADDGGGIAGGIAMNCVFSNNSASYGGGMHTGIATNCSFLSNTANWSGGGLYDGIATNCVFSDNESGNGGGMYKGTAINSIFMTNYACYGGGMYYGTATNCTFYDNSLCGPSSSGSGRYQGTTTNCIIWECGVGGSSAVVTYSCIQDGYSGTGNISSDPLFVDAVGGDLNLMPGSPCINTGTADDAPMADILGIPRPQDSGYDMGAYEIVFCSPDITSPVITLMGSDPQFISIGQTYTELGAQAIDTCEGDVSAQIVIDASAVDTSTIGSYPVTYNVSDSVSNAALTVTRTIEVAGPLTIIRPPDIELSEGASRGWSAIATGGTGALSYQWQRLNGIDYFNVVDGPFGFGTYMGATTGTLVFAPFTEIMAGTYRIEVSDDQETVYSEPAIVTFNPVPIPVSSMLGLLGLAAVSALAGALALRRRR